MLASLTLLAVLPTAKLDALARDYGIEIVALKTVNRASRYSYDVVGRPVPPEVLAKFEAAFETEWRRYPPSLMRRVGLRRITLATDVRVLGQPRAVVPEFGPGWFWLDVGVAARNPAYGIRSLHHDFFHMIDERDDAEGRSDRVWTSLNPKGTRYGIGGWWMQTGNAGALRTDLPGFLTAYSTSAVEEDKAEVFSHLLCDTGFVEKRAAADPVLAAKVARIKRLVAAFEPAMNEAWWRANGAASP